MPNENTSTSSSLAEQDATRAIDNDHFEADPYDPAGFDYSPFVESDGRLTPLGEAEIMRGLRILMEASWRNADAHGFHESGRGYLEELFLINSEIAEAGEAYRGSEPELWYANKTTGQAFGSPVDPITGLPRKAEGMTAELADAIIRIGDTTRGTLGDLPWAVVTKMRYNYLRPRMHGKKA